MLSSTIVIAATLGYAGLLFLVAWLGDHRKAWLATPVARAAIYGLSLAVYCTSWTFFGAVGTAARDGWDYLPIYLGPILVFVAAFPVVARLVDTARRNRVTSVADFISARYGKSESLAALATLVVVAGALPYIALQLKSAVASFQFLTGGDPGEPAAIGLVLALALALFTMLFGTRHRDVTQHNRGLMMAVALESVVKIGALVVLALFAWHLLPGDGAPLPSTLEATPAAFPFVTLSLLSMGAIIALDRQFHTLVVECPDAGDLRPARWTFSLYMVIIALVVPPIATAGLAHASLTAVNPDLFVLALPMAAGNDTLALLAFLGGFSAGTSMVVVTTLAVATMAANHLVMPNVLPLLARQSWDAGRFVLWLRRLVILVLMLAGHAYFQAFGQGQTLAATGTLSFALAAQLMPALIGGLYWRRAHKSGAFAGLGTGALMWLVLLFLPITVEGSYSVGLGALGEVDRLTFGVLASLGVNLLMFVVVSLRAEETFLDQQQAARFVGTSPPGAPPPAERRWRTGELTALVGRFAGEKAAELLTARLALVRPRDPASPELQAEAEALLTRIVGAASARILLEHGPGAKLYAEEVASLIEAGAQQVQFSQTLLQATLEHVQQAIFVTDAELRIVAWNSHYLSWFAFPAGLIDVGVPLERALRWQAETGAIGDMFADAQICLAMEKMRQREPYTLERTLSTGRIVQAQGDPMPDGLYVTTFTDITGQKRTEQALRDSESRLTQANIDLESRVRLRTAELEKARAQAEAATQSKTRFLAAASHDIMQPLNAARLFAGALREDLTAPHEVALTDKIERSINAADQILRTLLDISRLDAGGLTPSPRDFPLDELFGELAEEFEVMATAKGLQLRLVRTGLIVHADRRLLRSVLQNFLSNAIKYTARGKVLLGARRRAGMVRIDVVDTGLGVPPEKLQEIFQEFRRLPDRDHQNQPGLGLGLAIVERISAMLDAPVDVRSTVGAGSRFSVSVPAAGRRVSARRRNDAHEPAAPAAMRVLCIDDDTLVLDSLRAILTAWGATAVARPWQGDLPDIGIGADGDNVDAVLIDYHLDAHTTGPMVVERLKAQGLCCDRVIVISGALDDSLKAELVSQGYMALPKPVRPDALRRCLDMDRRGTDRTAG